MVRSAGSVNVDLGRPSRAMSFRRALLGAAATGAFLPLTAREANAQCVPDPAPPNGTVTCANFDGDGFVTSDTPMVIVIQPNAQLQGRGLQVLGDADVDIDNSGAVQANSGASVILTANAGATRTFTNNATGAVNGAFTFDGAGDLVLIQSGQINGALTVTGTGSSDITLNSSLNGPVTITGARAVFRNAGSVNAGLRITSPDIVVINQQGAQVSGTFALGGTGTIRVDNSGAFNSGVGINASGVVVLTNFASGRFLGPVSSLGSSHDTLDNSGEMTAAINLGDGDDILINRTGRFRALILPGGIRNTIDMGSGDDRIFLLGGEVNGSVTAGAGRDIAVVSGGTLTNTLDMGGDDDQVTWSGGTLITLDMGTGDDLATLVNLTGAILTAGLRVDGDFGDDTLVWDNTAAGDVGCNTSTGSGSS